ncbi:MAG TPA: vitamin K epoxide reductase family protein [Anaerolineales bacterium]|nr:vitamin K epoxide reductase family protein [Anaerolineales bacterium]
MKNKTIGTITILSVIGLIDSVYLLIYKLSNNNAMCLGSGDCATVNASRYSELYGIPVALLGVLAYLAIIILVFFEMRNLFTKENSSLLIFGISLVGVLFSGYLTYIEYFVIYAVCPFCVASAIVITIIFIISLIRLVNNLSN